VALVALGALLVLAVVAGVGFGAVAISPGEVIAALARAIRGVAGPTSDAVIVDIRLPRVVLAALVGASLATAGVLYQALFRNPLADPYILGVSSGAGLGAILVIVTTTGATVLRYFGVPVGAFIGAILTMVLVVKLASWRGRLEPTSLLLAGVAISYTLAALTSFVMVFSRESMTAIVFWMMGGLTSASWQYVGVVAVMLAIGIVVPLTSTRALNVMLLGDERAGQLGVDVERFKRLVLAAASLLTAGAVAVSGLIGFIGLMTPHAVRLVLGPDHRGLVPASILGGAVLMVAADLAARTVLAPVEIPVGIVTALTGGPFFVWLLIRGSRSL
jgi:iron complex transport system permease protein